MTRARRILSALAVTVLVTAGLVTAGVQTGGRAVAADAVNFDPGNIISNAQFYDTSTMTAADIQGFLNSKGAACTTTSTSTSTGAGTCLKNYTMPDSLSKPDQGTGNCTAYQGNIGDTAATIIYKVAQACGINPEVLLVLLQKEQGLVTSTSPTSYMYSFATGYGCPDSTGCTSSNSYPGFQKQVYAAAWQFRYYALHPTSFTFYVGSVSVGYAPNTACGSSVVNIQNQATANLYNYTPYQPNAAALANLYGSGDSCSSYGNRNFWRYYSDWFGSPTGPLQAGNLDTALSVPGAIHLTGWWVDFRSYNPLPYIWVSINGVGGPYAATNPLPWIPQYFSQYPSVGANHGFDLTIKEPPGTYQVCVVGTRDNLNLGCKTVTVRGGLAGSLDSATATVKGINLSGWAVDFSTANPTYTWINVDGSGAAHIADAPRPWFDGLFTGYGNDHGYNVTIPKPAGTYNVCAYNINGSTQGCRNVTVPSNAVGSFDSAVGVPGGIKLSGWSADLLTTNPSYIWVNVNGTGGPQVANVPLSWFEALYPGAGLNHGFNTTIAKPPGTYQVCIYGTNSQPLGCKTVTVPSNAAGSFDSATAVSGGINVKGWSVDLSTPNPSYIWVNVNGSGGPQVANVPLSWFDTMFPGEGPNHGFNATISKPPGTYQVCIYGTNSQALGCKTVTVQ